MVLRHAAVFAAVLSFLFAVLPDHLPAGAVSSPPPSGDASTQNPKADETWAVVGGERIGRVETEKEAEQELANLRAKIYEIQRRSLDRLIERKILEREAKKRGISVEQLIETEVKSKIPPVTDEEVGKDLARYRMGRTSGNVDKSSLHRGIYIQKYYGALKEYVDSLRQDIPVEVLLKQPEPVERPAPRN